MAYLQYLNDFFSIGNYSEQIATVGASLVLIAAAEMGDKSQLVCMTLASRHRGLPVILGATAAFALLNSLAVIFGVSISKWLPDYLVALMVALLFAVFGIGAFLNHEDESEDEPEEKSGHGIFITTFLLITVAEFGDKTQLAVVALSSAASPAAVWTGSTLALAFTSLLGVMAGRTVLQKIPVNALHKLSGILFLILAVWSAVKAYEIANWQEIDAYLKQNETLQRIYSELYNVL